MNTPVSSIPAVKQMVAIREDLRISFSTTFPIKAADIPRKNIAKLNAHSTLAFPKPI
ncbi:MAG: hypothetical protein K6F86_09680 [Lachnospiraceae bacterium]|nr:hypothetical protein [Lachnospiraceae bacterium]